MPPEGALRLRPGKAGSAAPTGEEESATPHFHDKRVTPGNSHA